MTRLEAIEILQGMLEGLAGGEYIHELKLTMEALDMAIMALSTEKTAEWRIVGKTTLHYECSKCGGAGDEWDKFCKHCGARMGAEE